MSYMSLSMMSPLMRKALNFFLRGHTSGGGISMRLDSGKVLCLGFSLPRRDRYGVVVWLGVRTCAGVPRTPLGDANQL